mgnify:CR=1 FL=1
METLSEHFAFEETTDVGQYIIQNEGVSVDARLILFGEIAVELPNWINEEE